MRRIYGNVVFATMLALGVSAGARADEAPDTWGSSTESNLSSLMRYYTTSMSSVGEFPGQLLSSPCDESSAPMSAPPCGSAQHFLVTEDDDNIHPLLPGTEEVRRQLESIATERVTVHGKYYESTGAILVDRICGNSRDLQC